jgi:hypothetical protein
LGGGGVEEDTSLCTRGSGFTYCNRMGARVSRGIHRKDDQNGCLDTSNVCSIVIPAWNSFTDVTKPEEGDLAEVSRSSRCVVKRQRNVVKRPMITCQRLGHSQKLRTFEVVESCQKTCGTQDNLGSCSQGQGSRLLLT